MIQMVWSQLLRRGSRSVAIFVGLLIASGGFTVLTAQTRAESLQVRQTVNSNARSAYDILVRPKGSVLHEERQQGLVRAGFLAGVQGGISLQQWHTIQHIGGVEVAAPVAVVGYVLPKIEIPVLPAGLSVPGHGRALLRLETTWHTDNGASVQRGQPSFAYLTPHPLTRSDHGRRVVEGAGGRTIVIQPDAFDLTRWTVASPPPLFEVHERTEYADPVLRQRMGAAFDPVMGFPFLVEAVDPSAEAELSGLKSAIVQGSFLKSGQLKTAPVPLGNALQVPVVVANRPATHISLRYHVSALSRAAANAVARGHGVTAARNSPGTTIARGSVDQDQAYRLLLQQMRSTEPGTYFAKRLGYLFTVGPVAYQVTASGQGRSTFNPRVVKNPRGVWGDPSGGDQSGPLIPAGGDDTAFRTMAGYLWSNENPQSLLPPTFAIKGTFDPDKLPGYSALSRVPLGTYASSELTGKTPKARTLLGNKPLQPSPNIAGYPQSAPLMITTLDALPAFEKQAEAWAPMTADRTSTPISPVNARAPLSSVRIRVAGVHGVDAQSRARVRLVAQQISAKTHLEVDITVGSSPSPQTVVLPAGQHGRPRLQLVENWVKKGTALVILQAVDKKSLILFLLVLVTCALFVGNATGAAVQARRRELGVLACLGWAPRQLVGIVAAEIAVLALTAGLAGAGVALLAGNMFSVPVSASRALLAVPSAVLVALLAGLLPARGAAHAPPLEAARRAVSTTRRAYEPRTVTALAAVNLRRNLGRSLVAAGSLTVAVMALTAVLGIQTAFRGAVVGNLLGNAVTVQIRGADVAAVIAILLLAALGVANVTYLNIRERGPELATLRAIGWPDAALVRLLLLESMLLGTMATLVGAVFGYGLLVVALGLSPEQTAGGMLLSLLIGVLIAPLASLAPTLSVNRLNTAQVLSEDY